MARKHIGQLALALPHRASLDGDDFLLAGCNEEAVSWLDRWPNWPEGRLCLVGPKACGKTHLVSVHQAQAGAAIISHDKLLSVPASDIVAGQQALVIEDADQMTGKVAEEALFHLINATKADGVTLLLSAQSPPNRWPIALKDLVSRLATFSVAAIKAPDDQVIMAVLAKLFHDRQLKVSADLLGYITATMERSFEAANDLVARLDRESLAGKRPVTKPLVREVLQHLDLQ